MKKRLAQSENRLTDWMAANILVAAVISVVGFLVLFYVVRPAFDTHRSESGSDPKAISSNSEVTNQAKR